MDDLVRRDLVGRAAAHGFAVPEDRDVIRDFLEFREAVRDVNDADSAFAELPHSAEDLGGFRVRKGRSGLVEDQQTRLSVECAADLDDLFLGRAEPVHAPVGLDREPVRFQNPVRCAVHANAIEECSATGLAP